MATEINKSTNRVDPPIIVINGKLVDTSTGIYAVAANHTINTQLETIESSSAVRKREALVFEGDVTVTITSDTDYTANSYSNRDLIADIVGATEIDPDTVAENSETYYTVNGKDPKRTKSNLYTGAFTIRRNLSGHDNTIIKARTFVNGKESPVRTVEIRVLRSNTNEV